MVIDATLSLQINWTFDQQKMLSPLRTLQLTLMGPLWADMRSIWGPLIGPIQIKSGLLNGQVMKDCILIGLLLRCRTRKSDMMSRTSFLGLDQYYLFFICGPLYFVKYDKSSQYRLIVTLLKTLISSVHSENRNRKCLVEEISRFIFLFSQQEYFFNSEKTRNCFQTGNSSSSTRKSCSFQCCNEFRPYQHKFYRTCPTSPFFWTVRLNKTCSGYPDFNKKVFKSVFSLLFLHFWWFI